METMNFALKEEPGLPAPPLSENGFWEGAWETLSALAEVGGLRVTWGKSGTTGTALGSPWWPWGSHLSPREPQGRESSWLLRR